MFSGETLFRNSYTANKDGLIAFASSFPGKIVAIDVEPGKEVIIQKSAFLASEENVETSVCFNKKFSSGIFGGEGFILTKISGHGTCFIEIDGSTVEYNLLPGQQMVIDTGYLAMMDATCKMDIQSVPGLKNKFLEERDYLIQWLLALVKLWFKQCLFQQSQIHLHDFSLKVNYILRYFHQFQ